MERPGGDHDEQGCWKRSRAYFWCPSVRSVAMYLRMKLLGLGYAYVQLGNANQVFKMTVLIYIHRSTMKISLLHFKTHLNIFYQF